MASGQVTKLARRRKEIARMGMYKDDKFVFSSLPGADSLEPVLKEIRKKVSSYS